jgi:adhesin/invasin
MRTHSTFGLFWLAAAAALFLAGCGSGGGGPSEPEDDGTPKVGHVYNHTGTGAPGYGAMGQTPGKTQLYWPQDVSFAPDGSAVVLDWNNHRVISLDKTSGRYELVVGVADGDFGDPCPLAPAPCEDVVAVNAKLNHPTHIVFDDNGDLVLCAWHNSMLLRVDMASGLMDRFCGNGARNYNGDDRPAATAFVDLPVGLAFDAQGRLCFGDQANMIIRMIDENGVIHTIAGTQPVAIVGPNGTSYQPQFGFSGDEGPATQAKLNFERGQVADPSGKICFDALGNLYIADTQNHAVRMVDTNGIIHRFAGLYPAAGGYSGDGGAATAAQLREPRDVAVDADGNVFIADTGNHVVRMVQPDGTISTVVGKFRGALGAAEPLTPVEIRAENGVAARDARLAYPFGVEVDATGRLWIADTENNVVRVLYR